MKLNLNWSRYQQILILGELFLHSFLRWSTKEDILKNVVNQMVLVPTDFYCMDKKILWKSVRPETAWWPNNILSNIIVCVPQKSKSHSGTTCEGVNDDRIFSLSGFSF